MQRSNDMDTYVWQFWGELPDGHRLFGLEDTIEQVNSDFRFAICDNSGREPQDTDDGVLWLDMSRPLSIGKDMHMDPPREVYSIPLVTSDDERTRTPTDARTIVLLASDFEWKVNVQGVLHTFAKVNFSDRNWS